jgi:hypothetical protein
MFEILVSISGSEGEGVGNGTKRGVFVTRATLGNVLGRFWRLRYGEQGGGEKEIEIYTGR